MKELRGMPVVRGLLEQFGKETKKLKEQGVIPKLVIIRIGAREDDLAYERGIYKRFQAVDALVETKELPLTVTGEEVAAVIATLNQDSLVHGIMLFRPLPKHLNEKEIKELIVEEKDVDCMGSANNAHIFVGDQKGYPPCTPQAVMELLDFYQIPLAGKKVTIVGRSMVVGKPLAMLMLNKNATVTICHTKTLNIEEECKKADILVVCAGVAKMIKKEYVSANQVVIDVGIHMVEDQLCGDVDYGEVADLVESITPVPGGIGNVTTSVLLKHTIMSALNR